MNVPEKQGLYDPRFEHDACGVGFIADIKGVKSNRIVNKGVEILNRLAHRGAVGSDPKTGDGAGILMQIPDDFFQGIAKAAKINLPNLGEYGTGIVFLPQNKSEREYCKQILEKSVIESGQKLLGWRVVPIDNSVIGKSALESEPVIEQVFIRKNSKIKEDIQFERKLYVIRKHAENIIRESDLKEKSYFYITNLSCRIFSYKGLLMTDQVDAFFVDLKDPKMQSAFALVHSRYSTNTFPTWDLAQPFRLLAHNGEINTIAGNRKWMNARESLLETTLFDKSELKKIKPVLVPDQSDSATIDNIFELLYLSGRPVEHAIKMLIPSAWEKNKNMDDKLKAFYRYHACLMEPWDGPAAIAFTDGINIGAVLDRNGLRPARYIITKDNMVVMASEVGVLDIPANNILKSCRLAPGEIFVVDTKNKRVIDDIEIRENLASKAPYGKWLKGNLIDLDTIKDIPQKQPVLETDIFSMMKIFGYTREDIKVILKPMAEKAMEPIGSMGTDFPHAVLSKKPQLLYTYFKQLFSQVTNPAIDPIREAFVMSLDTYVGPQKNILSEDPLNCKKIFVKNPMLTNLELAKIKSYKKRDLKTKVISILFDAKDEKNFSKVIDKICKHSALAVKEGYTTIVLSDRGVNEKKAAIPALFAVGAVHHHLVAEKLRTRVGLIIESAEPREVHHFVLLLGYGVDCINPYFVYDIFESLRNDNELDVNIEDAVSNYRKAAAKGIFKTLSKMGISTLQSYRGAHIFEALGLADDVIAKAFGGTVSRIGGATIDIIVKETLLRHNSVFKDTSVLDSGGVYQYKKDGEHHLWNPQTIALLQDSVRKNNYKTYKEFAELINDQSENPVTLRSLFKFKEQSSIPLERVEPVSEIVKRFATGAMSFGSISQSVHETIAVAMNRLGGKSNTGEGGEDPARFFNLPNGDSKRSSIKQVASGRFGVTTNYLVNADEIQIKIAQGAKPGEGGQLPGHKVSVLIAKTRYTAPGVTLISPPPHHDIYSIEDLAQLIFDLKNTNPNAKISVKLVSEVGVGTVAAGVAKGHADTIVIAGADGGTGASPLSSIRYAGLPWELGISETHQTLLLNDLRSRVRLQTDGQMRTGKDLVVAALLGAEEFGFGTVALIVMGCVMLRHCHLNNCSLGIAMQDQILEKRFRGKSEYLVNYFNFVANDVREIMAELGFETLNELIGRSELIEVDKSIIPWKAKNIDFSNILYKPKVEREIGTYCIKKQYHGVDSVLDKKLIQEAQTVLHGSDSVYSEFSITNDKRTVGAMLSGEVCKNYGEWGLPDDSIWYKFNGIAGQSFGAFLAKGVTFELEGLSNDYLGKGISGGKIIVYPSKDSDYKPEKNIIIGNTTFYGAISGEAYINGLAGERFCIRNSGLHAVVEGIGDNGCEYMTGGRVIILGKTGRNFAAGMSGGVAYVYDPDGDFEQNVNLELVGLETVVEEDKELMNHLLSNHWHYSGSLTAKKILDNFNKQLKKFVKVVPFEYKNYMNQRKG